MPGALDFSPKKNWVEKAGGLPQYIERIAIHLIAKGMTRQHAIATAINVVKKACATGDLNYPGLQHENKVSQAEACAAVAHWTAMKAARSADTTEDDWADLWHNAKVLDEAGDLPEDLSEEDNKALGDIDLSDTQTPESDQQVRSGAEYRSVPFKDAELKGRVFRGYAAVYDTEADLGEFTEEIRRGAFRKVLSTEPDVPMLFNHNAQLPPIASTRSGMALKDDGRGLLVEAELADHFVGQAVLEGVERGDIRGMSFGFVAGKGNSEVNLRSGRPHRAITNFNKLLDVSPTHDPAYAQTSAEVRSMIQQATLLEAPQTERGGEEPQIPCDCGGAENAPESVEDPGFVPEEQRAGVTSPEVAARRRLLERQAIVLGLPRPE